MVMTFSSNLMACPFGPIVSGQPQEQHIAGVRIRLGPQTADRRSKVLQLIEQAFEVRDDDFAEELVPVAFAQSILGFSYPGANGPVLR